MKYSQSELRVMDEDDINSIVHEIKHPKGSDYDNLFNAMTPSDYCNNPSDIMPIAFKNRMRLTPWHNDQYQCAKYTKEISIECVDKNPYRAMCIVFILMKQDEESKQ